MANLTQALTGWTILMGMVLGGVGALFLVLSAIRSLIAVVRPARIVTREASEAVVA